MSSSLALVLLEECSPGSSWGRMSQTWIQRYRGKGRIQLVGNSHGSCPKGWWHHVVVWRLCCYCQPPIQHSSVSNFPAWLCLCQAARVKTIQQAWFNECSSETPIGTWQSALCNHQYTLWSVMEQKATFWYCIIPGNFQRIMDIILQGIEHVAVILHDILIMGKDDEQHIQNLNSVLRCLNSSVLELQPNKSEFMQQLVTFMGCVIFAEGISPTEENIEAIKKVPCPENSTQLRAFLRMINIHNLRSILQPLNQLVQKDQEFLKIVNRPLTRQRNRSLPNMSWCITILA